MTKILLSGNEAVARGAYEAGAGYASAYPGTPSTEILETIAGYSEVQAEWAPNEKVALEAGIGASLAGVRTLIAMKHVGLNVAADPFFTLSYTGVAAGIVIVSADDPGMHSSQNEQDNRHYARAAKVPMLEPSSSAEAHEFVRRAFDLSEAFDTPVLLRVVTRLSHGRGPVETGGRRGSERPIRFDRDPKKYVMVPANARGRHVTVERRRDALRQVSEGDAWNRIEWRGRSLGVISSGIPYTYVREVAPEASTLKLGMTWPIPDAMIRAFAAGVERLAVIEDLDPYLADHVRALGIPLDGEVGAARLGELSPEEVRRELFGGGPPPAPEEGLPPRPPVMCPGCPHRGLFATLRKKKLAVMGDIGCYTLGVAPPLSAMDTCICMGASVGCAHGSEKVGLRGVVGVIGDSTFVHSGITGLVHMVYNKSGGTLIIADNGTTAMTGRQDHPATGRTLQGEATAPLDLEALARAIGVRDVRVVDPHDLPALERALDEAVASSEPSVIIARRPCVLLRKAERKAALWIDESTCGRCGRCLDLGCPALVASIEGDAAGGGQRPRRLPSIVEGMCVGCGLCADVCPREAVRAPDAGGGAA